MRSFFLLLLSVLSLFSCEKPKTEHSKSSENEKNIHQFFEHFNKHDWEKMASMYTDPAEFRDPSLGKDIVKQTRQDTKVKYEALNGIFPDIKDSILHLYASGDKHIIVEFLSTGTAPDGSKLELPICTVFTLENGLITHDFTYYDNME